MIKFKGTTLYPPAVFDLLGEMDDVLDFAVEVYSNEVGLDEILLHIVPVSTGEEGDHRIRAYLQARLRVSPHIEYLTQEQMLKKQFPESARKAIKFIDRRNESK
jgi:phenylacetate-CoA ligase